jgi:hypothetical protein
MSVEEWFQWVALITVIEPREREEAAQAAKEGR